MVHEHACLKNKTKKFFVGRDWEKRTTTKKRFFVGRASNRWHTYTYE
jgi:hypothetical protein